MNQKSSQATSADAGEPLLFQQAPDFALRHDHVLRLPIVKLTTRIAQRELSAVELVGQSLQRAHTINPALNAFCLILDEEALRLAEKADAAVKKGDPLGPLHGIPFAAKDLTPTRGHLTTRGSWTTGNWIPDHTALCIERLQAAGAILIGKTTTPEFAFSSFTQSKRWGVTRNPWNTSRTPGGSSGGSAVAVATGCVPFAEGTDMGGSVRIPAACCGVVGVKPSLGRIPMTILPSQFDSISHFGPLARTVEDAAVFIAATAGPSSQDIQSLTEKFRLENTNAQAIKGTRFAVSMDQGYYRVDPAVRDAMLKTLTVLRDAGAVVEEVALPWTRANNDQWYDYWCVFMASFFGHHVEEFESQIDAEVVEAIVRGKQLSAVQFKSIEFLRTKIWQEFSDVLDRFDYFLTPTCSIPAPPADHSDKNYYSDDANGKYEGFEMTLLFNLIPACPVVSLPIGLSPDGLPIGMQVVGQRFADESVLAVSRRIEALLAKSRLWS